MRATLGGLALGTCLFFSAGLQAAALPPLAAHPLLYGHFIQTKHIAGLSLPLTSQGDFLVVAGQGVIWRTLKPFKAAVAVTGKGLWSLQELNGSVKREALHQGSLGTVMEMIQQVLSGNLSGLGKYFKVSPGGTPKAWILDLEPLDPVVARVISRLHLEGSKDVKSVDYHEANGDSTRIVFSGVRYDVGELGTWQAAAFGA